MRGLRDIFRMTFVPVLLHVSTVEEGVSHNGILFKTLEIPREAPDSVGIARMAAFSDLVGNKLSWKRHNMDFYTTKHTC